MSEVKSEIAEPTEPIVISPGSSVVAVGFHREDINVESCGECERDDVTPEFVDASDPSFTIDRRCYLALTPDSRKDFVKIDLVPMKNPPKTPEDYFHEADESDEIEDDEFELDGAVEITVE